MDQKKKLYFIYLGNACNTPHKNLIISGEFEVANITLEDSIRYKGCNNSLIIICTKNVNFDIIDFAYYIKGLVFIEELKLNKHNASLVDYLYKRNVPIFWDIKDLMIFIKRYYALKQVKTYDEVVKFLLETDLASHSFNVSKLSGLIASKLGYDCATSEMIEKAALLHDIGKIAIPYSFLNSSHYFNEAEKNFVSLHVLYGCNLLEDIRFLDCDESFIKLCRNVALSHHERHDGSGYPIGLANGTIPVAAKIVAVTDVYDAIKCSRPYKIACGHALALSFLKVSTDKFDQEVVDALEAITLDNLKDKKGGYIDKGQNMWLKV